MDHLAKASQTITLPSTVTPPFLDASRYAGARVIDQKGTIIGEVESVSGDTVNVVLGGWRDAWGFVDFSGARHISIPAATLAFTAPHVVGVTLVALPITVA